jgi:DNA-binding NarL/FixJ family response regulator
MAVGWTNDDSFRPLDGGARATSECFLDEDAQAADVLIADDHRMLRDGLRLLFEAEPDFRVVGEAGDGEEAVRLVRDMEPEILLLELHMPRRPGLEVLRELATFSSVRTILLTAEAETAELVEAIQLGARGIVLKQSGSDVLFECIRSVMAGGYWIGREKVSEIVQVLHSLLPRPINGSARSSFGLTPREREVIAAVVAGYTNKDIAQKFSISQNTVKHHITNVFDKLGVCNRLELVLFAVEYQLLAP